MTTTIIYKYQHPNGILSIGPNKPETGEYQTYYRLVADEGKNITDGMLITKSVDTKDIDTWSEIDDVEAPKEEFKFPTLDDYR